MHSSTGGLTQILLRRCATAVGVLLSLIFIVAVSAQEVPLKPDVRLVIDVSGSMKRNDPNNLRQPAVDLLVRLVPDGGKAGVWTFGKYVNMLVPHQLVDNAWREAASRKSAEINSVGLFTNIGGALETAAQDMARGNPGYATSVILLTDGMVDISKSLEENEAEWRRVVDQVFPALKKAGYKVHAVALSEEADRNLMEKLAITTGGTFAVAKTADDLMKIFLQAFDLAVPSQKVPLLDNRFLVDSSVNEFTALIFRKNPTEQTRLVGPDEETIQAGTKRDDVRWQRTDEYDLITVRKPYEGEWQIIAAIEPESRVTVVSNLALRVKDLPSNLFRGNTESLSFVLQGDGKPIIDMNFLKLVENRVSLSFGQTVESVAPGYWEATLPGDAANGSGLYTIELPALDKMGVYDLQLTVDGQTFVRQFAHRFTVREPFSASLDLAADEGVMRHILTVRSHSELIDPSQTQIVATLITPQRRRLVRPVEMVRPDQWQTSVPIEVPGEYQVAVQVAGTDTRKDPFDYTLTPFTYQHSADMTFPPAPVSEPEPEPEPETPPIPPEIPAAEPELKEESELPSWLLYVALGLGNLAILAGGYWLFRKRTKDGADAAAERAGADIPLDVTPPANVMSMDEMAMEDEPEPPMEDLADDDPEPEDEIPALNDVVTDEDLHEDLVEQVMGGESEEAKEDFAAEIRRVQGLDMDEDELDDAISNLIDELDGEPRPGPKPADLDDIDFPDEDKLKP